jgi:hypothetical protein
MVSLRLARDEPTISSRLAQSAHDQLAISPQLDEILPRLANG